ncbi:ribosome biogenesis GTP-binding protein YihA/YsxC [Candidatus Gracilibacteria bacterium]|nr:ribosome biogenesis GTP-binding protein YihA/YsxC [Candidatus Gracilibacteria bacterium]
MIVSKASFVKSASKFEELPESDFPEFAMIGRSNVGKSSLINTLSNNGSLSKISNKPGKTKLMNFFLINDSWYLVDLPGYGYAKSGKGDRAYWIDTTQQYFLERSTLRRVFVLIDGSIPPQKIDLDFIYTLNEENIRFDIVMTKIDKGTQKDLSLHTRLLGEELASIVSNMPKIFMISNVNKRGRDKLLDYIQDLIG